MSQELTATPEASPAQPQVHSNSANASLNSTFDASSNGDNLEEYLLELNNFEKEVSKGEKPLVDVKIPQILENYLKLVADSGYAQFPWHKIKPLFRVKLEQVIHEFCLVSPTTDIPPTPNVDPFSFETVKEKVLEQLDMFIGIPFTVQRLAELVTTPRRHYRRTDKFMRALEKNMLVVSTVEARAMSSASSEMLSLSRAFINGTEHDVLPRAASPMKRSTSPTTSGFVKTAKLSEDEASEPHTKDGATDDENKLTPDSVDMEESATDSSTDETKVADSSEDTTNIQPSIEEKAKVAIEVDPGQSSDTPKTIETCAQPEPSEPATADKATSSSSETEPECSSQKDADTKETSEAEAPQEEQPDKPDEGAPSADDGGPTSTQDCNGQKEEKKEENENKHESSQPSEVGSSESQEASDSSEIQAKDLEKETTKVDASSDSMEIDEECSSSQYKIHTSP